MLQNKRTLYPNPHKKLPRGNKYVISNIQVVLCSYIIKDQTRVQAVLKLRVKPC